MGSTAASQSIKCKSSNIKPVTTCFQVSRDGEIILVYTCEDFFSIDPKELPVADHPALSRLIRPEMSPVLVSPDAVEFFWNYPDFSWFGGWGLRYMPGDVDTEAELATYLEMAVEDNKSSKVKAEVEGEVLQKGVFYYEAWFTYEIDDS